MTTKYRAILVTLKNDVREDDIGGLLEALRFFDFVNTAEPCVESLDLAAMVGSSTERKRCIDIMGEALRAVARPNYVAVLNPDGDEET